MNCGITIYSYKLKRSVRNDEWYWNVSGTRMQIPGFQSTLSESKTLSFAINVDRGNLVLKYSSEDKLIISLQKRVDSINMFSK